MGSARKFPDKQSAIRGLNRPLTSVAISLLWSQTIDLFASRTAPELREKLELLRRNSTDGVKVTVDRILPADDGYTILTGAGEIETLQVSSEAIGEVEAVPGGGLCNLSKDLEVILDVFGDDRGAAAPLEYLSWSDSKEHFSGSTVEGITRTSLIFQDEGFDKIILCERGPSFSSADLDPWEAEREFYEGKDCYIFIGQEPMSSKKFEYVHKRKLENPSLKVFWLVGGNQLKKLFTEYRNFLSVVDVVSMNLAEAAKFFCLEPLQKKHRIAYELRTMYAREIGRRTLELGANHVVITDGATGASLASKARGGNVEFVYSPLIQENIIEVDNSVREDTGCGDSFAAAVAAYFLTGSHAFKLNEAANFAHYVAGIIYQRRRANLTEKDRGFVEFAYNKAKASGAFVGKHETFDRSQCQISPASIRPRGPRNNILVMILGGDPADPTHPYVTGAGAAARNLAAMCVTGEYERGPLVKVVPRLTTSAEAQNKACMITHNDKEMARMIDQGLLCKEIGDFEGEQKNGVLKTDLMSHEGVYILRVTLLEALEVLSSEDFAEWFGDIKLWHFFTENVDERLVWYAKQRGLTREQGDEITRQTLRDYIIASLGPKIRFSNALATNLEEFEREMTEQLILRIDALLEGMFRSRA